MLLPPFVCKHAFVACIMWFIMCPIFLEHQSTLARMRILFLMASEGVTRRDEAIKEVLHTPNAMSFVIALATNKTLLFCHLFNEDGQGTIKFLKGDKLNETLLKFTPLCSPNIHNLISLIKHCPRKMGSIDSILTFMGFSPYNYIQDSCFLG